MNTSRNNLPKTLGELVASGYQPKSIKEEMRINLISKLKAGKPLFPEIIGFEQTVIPDLERAILSKHSIVFLGLRGQGKTRMARLMVKLLDEYIPVVEGSSLNDDPLQPISRYAIDKLADLKDATPISWMHKSERYTEKLATPDVSIADLIGDVDPIKAANLKLSYEDERVIHFGMVPRSHRCLFVINELPDLQARIQVSLFNMLQEGDIQIRGFKLRLPLDISFVFTANPEDYTNRGSIVTPLKDRIESQILTHYPTSIEISKQITKQEAKLNQNQIESIEINELSRDLIEQIAVEARQSEFVDANSGVSARLTISAMENLYSAAERRMLINSESKSNIRLGDFWGVIPSVTGKVELVYEGEQEGPHIVAQNLIGKAMRTQFAEVFPSVETSKKKERPENRKASPYQTIIDWFGNGNHIDLINDASEIEYQTSLKAVDGLMEFVLEKFPDSPLNDQYFKAEFILHGLAEHSLLSKQLVKSGFKFGDLFNSMFNFKEDDPEFG